jgi:sugar (pentulose or hexulose) kinase
VRRCDHASHTARKYGTTVIVRLGIDAGTSAVKVVAFDEAGRVIAGEQRAMPPLVFADESITQPCETVLEFIEHAITATLARLDTRPALVALCVQRDTAVLLDVRGRPVTDLISWRDARHLRHGSVWDALAAAAPELSGPVRARSLASLLTERWTGTAAENDATRPRHLAEPYLARLQALLPEADLPETMAIGARVGEARGDVLPSGVPLHLAAGDKNAELLGASIRAPGTAGLSMGSAISLGICLPGARPPDGPGRVITPAAQPGAWNVETGLPVGTGALEVWRGWAGSSDIAPGPGWVWSLWCVPVLAGALDGSASPGVLAGIGEHTTIDDVCRAWAQGVLCEIARLAAFLEGDADPIREVVVYGGGATTVWRDLVADVLDRPVRLLEDPWRGARGAVASALFASGHCEDAEQLLSAADPGSVRLTPGDRELARRVLAYRDTWLGLFQAGRALDGNR